MEHNKDTNVYYSTSAAFSMLIIDMNLCRLVNNRNCVCRPLNRFAYNIRELSTDRMIAGSDS